MADISADTLLPSGTWAPSLCTGVLSIASGSSGTLLTVNSTGGRKIRLTLLGSSVGGGSETGISVTRDGSAVVSSLTLQANASPGNFWIGPSGTTPVPPLIEYIEAFNTITITKASGSTSNNIFYAIEQGF